MNIIEIATAYTCSKKEIIINTTYTYKYNELAAGSTSLVVMKSLGTKRPWLWV